MSLAKGHGPVSPCLGCHDVVVTLAQGLGTTLGYLGPGVWGLIQRDHCIVHPCPRQGKEVTVHSHEGASDIYNTNS